LDTSRTAARHPKPTNEKERKQIMPDLLRIEDYRNSPVSLEASNRPEQISAPPQAGSAQPTSLVDDPGFMVCSEQMHSLARTAQRVAASTATVLITGESGTGKEVLARWIHRHGRRSQQAYIRVNCAALAESLIESELFGHERGAFTGAHEQRIGKFELASGGTLLLDEVSEIPLRIQAKLLRVLEEQELERVGGNETVKLNVRVLATSNRNLAEEATTGRFRLDLYHRLNIVHFHLPPLRERPTDLELLVRYFCQQFKAESPAGVEGFSSRALEQLREYPWPGNVRQLRNTVHRACLLSPDRLVQHAPLDPLAGSGGDRLPVEFCNLTLAEMERRIIEASLVRFQGNKRLAAESLGITARTITNKLNEYRELDSRAA
jgi:DNA-binding NtrC family response regulator